MDESPQKDAQTVELDSKIMRKRIFPVVKSTRSPDEDSENRVEIERLRERRGTRLGVV